MGLLIDGVWHDRWYETKSSGGKFVRSASQFRNWITPDGRPGPSGNGSFEAEAGRYHLYVSLACPWAHRTLIMRTLKGLEQMISVSVVDALMLDQGWTFNNPDASAPAGSGDTLYGLDYLHQVYSTAQPDYTGRVTVPVLWDKKQQTIVNNESSEIIRMLNSAFDHLGAKVGDYYPQALQSEIDAVNEWVYPNVNNGVYRAGFATSQAAYDEAVAALFNTLDELDEKLSKQRYLVGDQVTEADIRLFTTLVRFDPVYVSHFKCDHKMIAEYPALSRYLRELYQLPGVAETTNMEHIRHHYFASHLMINPTGIIPVGPEFDLLAPHGREQL
ncbi:glutathione S-transferase family protein [Pontibacterium granulatum]|uniref:glutathione S-transferase family protein n=1 Tax=Pontibacterium granulatum TaxID=2036029 RepID=UPI00249A6765|nr:glutathione S-transferase family protein [Pontibacterium granulatum]MDI3324388.1 glutathione S-transferase family protein [Pontibacterium granulatum]